MSYSYIKKSPFSFFETLDELRIIFAEKGFGVVSTIDIAKKIRLKVDKDFGEYTNIGFCSPTLAHKYLSVDMNLGIFMPCTVSIYEKEGDVFISAGLPENVISKVIGNSNLEELNKEVSEKMKEMIDSI